MRALARKGTIVNQIKVGSDLQAYCTSCKDMQEHVVVAMVGKNPAKVECGHCHRQHLFRAGPPGTAKVKAPASPRKPRASSTAAAGRRAAPPAIDLAALTAGREARAYSPAALFATGDVVRHPSFGVGVVVLLPGPQKMEVAFQEGQKLLAHGRDAVGPQLARPAPRNDDDPRRVSDAPPDRPPRH